MDYVGTPLPYLEEFVCKFLVNMIIPSARIFCTPDFQLITFLQYQTSWLLINYITQVSTANHESFGLSHHMHKMTYNSLYK